MTSTTARRPARQAAAPAEMFPWADTPEVRELEAEEGFVADLQGFLQELLNLKAMSRADLARALGVTPARVSQIFSDDCNITVRQFAKTVHALGEQPTVECDATRATRATRQSTRRDELIGMADNVATMKRWTQTPQQTEDELHECNGDDVRLDGVIMQLHAAGGRP